jgi:hypothetical protein
MERYIPYFHPNMHILQEKLYIIKMDVDYIYNIAFKEFIDDLNSNSLKELPYYMNPNGDFAYISSNELKCNECVEANKVNPSDIYCGCYAASYYNFSKGGEIMLSLNFNVVKMIYNQIKIPLSTSKFRRLVNELSEKKIKATIAHELSHWLDESLYQVFSKLLGDEKDDEKVRKLLALKGNYADITYYEIQAQIHGVAQIKNKYKKEDWDKLTMNELFELYPPLADVIELLYKKNDEDIARIWLKGIIKRLHREHLLGKNMIKSLDIKKLLDECYHPMRIW